MLVLLLHNVVMGTRFPDVNSKEEEGGGYLGDAYRK